jgi:hypothetical protein
MRRNACLGPCHPPSSPPCCIAFRGRQPYTDDDVAEVISAQHGNAIILRGSFNPRILQPAWLAAQNLIRPAESETAEIYIIHEQVVAFGLEWASVEVKPDLLTISSSPTSETPEQIRDLALGVIEILTHTPVYNVGLQFFGHYAFADQEIRDDLGWTLVPRAPFQGQLASVGMRTLTMLGRREEGDQGANGVSITVEPSAVLTPNGVYLAVLDQYDVADPSDPNVGAEPGIDAIKVNWEPSARRATSITDEVLGTV